MRTMLLRQAAMICVVLVLPAFAPANGFEHLLEPMSQLKNGKQQGEYCFPTYLPWVIETLQIIEGDPGAAMLCPQVDKGYSRLSYYLKMILFAQVACEDCQVDIVLQHHMDPEKVELESPGVYDSQKRLLQLFETERYELIGIEGEDDDVLNLEAMQNRAKGNLTAAESRADLLRMAPRQAFGVYMVLDPDQRMIGIEERWLQEINIATIASDEHGKTIINDMLVVNASTRSEIGLAKVVAKMHNLGLTRGAIVMGFLHKPSLERAAQWFNVKYRIIDTTSTEWASGLQ